MKILSYLVLLFSVLFFPAQQPAERYAVPFQAFPKIKSSVTMPVKIPLSEIGNVINASLPNLIYDDQSYTDNNNDQFKVKVWKTRPIRLVGGTRQNLLIEVPLKIWAEKGIGTLGFYSYQDTTFETVMYFSTQITLNSNWSITTKTSPMGFKWVTKPLLDYGKIKIPVTTLVESSLKEQQIKFSNIIDQMMVNQLNFKQYAVMAWNQFAVPFPVSEEYRTWLKVTPVQVNISPLVFYRDRLDTEIGFDVYSETFTGAKPAASAKISDVPDLRFVSQIPPHFLLQTTANIPYADATALAEQTFLGRDMEFRGNQKIKVTAVRVYGAGEKIMIEVKTEGAVNGISYISGIPEYDITSRKIVLRNTGFKLKTTNIIQKAATLLFQRKIVKMIEQEYGIPTVELDESARRNIEETFNKEYYKGLKMKGRVFQLKPSAVFVNAYGITAVIDTQARLELQISDF